MSRECLLLFWRASVLCCRWLRRYPVLASAGDTADLVQDNLVQGLDRSVTHRYVSASLWTLECWVRFFLECNQIVTSELMRITRNSDRLRPIVFCDECDKRVKEQID